MGNTPARVQAPQGVAATEKSLPGESKIFRSSQTPDGVVSQFEDRKMTNAWDLFQHGVSVHPNGRHNCIGSRTINSKDGSLGEYSWISYRELENRALGFGSFLINKNLVPIKEFPEEQFEGCRSMRMVALYTKNRPEWFIAEQAANAYGVAMVPLYDTLGEEAMAHILKQTDLETVVVSGECCSNLLRVLSTTTGHSVRAVIVLDKPTEDQQEAAKKAEVKFYRWESCVESGLRNKQPPTPGAYDAVQTLCYTSGTTGVPKGVILTNSAFVAVVVGSCRAQFNTKEMHIGDSDVYVSYLPLAHVYERAVIQICFYHGASIGCYAGDALKLLDDIKTLRPTIFVSVPRLFNRIHDTVNARATDRSAMAQYLFGSGMSTKLGNLRKDASVSHSIWDKLVFNKLRALLGGRVRFMVSGGAPLDAKVAERVSCILCTPIVQGFGMTETMGPCLCALPFSLDKSTVGGPFGSAEIKVVAVPDMNYLAEGREPEGELWVRGPQIAKGYFRLPEETKAAFTPEGWMKTGDIARIKTDGTVQIVDRKKNIFKLAQGEYVAPEKIENVYLQCSLIAQIFADGVSTEPNLVAIVVPDATTSARWARKNTKEGEVPLEQLVTDEAFRKAVVDEMENVAKVSGLHGFEKIRSIHLVAEQFTVENDLLTPTFKLKRAAARQKYQVPIANLYAKL